MLTEGQKELIALGRFVGQFAQAEHYLLETLRVLGGVSEEFARAALAGMRADQAIASLTRLFELTDLDGKKQAAYNDVFAHFRQIGQARNLIFHYGIDYGVSTDKSRALTKAKVRSIPVSAEILDQMTDDADKITSHLIVNMFEHGYRRQIPIDAHLRETLQRPWRYKSPAQSPREKPAARTRNTKRGRRPKSSQA